MTEKSSNGRKVAAFFSILALSGVTMLWAFWHFPKTTLAIAIMVLAGFAVTARLARSTDSDLSDLERGERSL